jgi:hypothetical protein
MKKKMLQHKREIRQKNVPQFQLVIANRSSLLARSEVRIVLLRPRDAVEGLKSAMPGEYDFPSVMTAENVPVMQCALRVNVHKILEKVKDSAC